MKDRSLEASSSLVLALDVPVSYGERLDRGGIMARSDIRKRYPGYKLIEVTYRESSDWRHFAVHDFTETLR